MLRLESNPGKILLESMTGRIIPLLSEEILSEYREVLNRPKFHFSKKAVDKLLKEIIKRSVFINPEPTTYLLPDPKDIIFYEIVMETRKISDSYLITGNTKHFPVTPFIVTPKEMLEILSKNEPTSVTVFPVQE
jgi:predicted nucleic acid-binding protein